MRTPAILIAAFLTLSLAAQEPTDAERQHAIDVACRMSMRDCDRLVNPPRAHTEDSAIIVNVDVVRRIASGEPVTDDDAEALVIAVRYARPKLKSEDASVLFVALQRAMKTVRVDESWPNEAYMVVSEPAEGK